MSEEYQVREFRAADYVAVHEARKAAGEAWLVANPLAVGEAYERFSLARTATHEGKVLGCAGFLEEHKGLARAWLLLTPEARRNHAIPVARIIRREFRELGARYRRIEAEVMDGWDAAIDLAGWLGFRVESVMPQWGPQGEQYVKVVILNASSSPPKGGEDA